MPKSLSEIEAKSIDFMGNSLLKYNHLLSGLFALILPQKGHYQGKFILNLFLCIAIIKRYRVQEKYTNF